jgi:hypothetical protein
MKLLKLTILLSLVIFISSCAVHIVPARDSNILIKVVQAENDTKQLYTNIMVAPDKSYAIFLPNYLTIDTEITDLITLEQSRVKGKIVYGMIKDIANRFAGYEATHRNQGTINNSEALIYQNGMEALWQPLYNSENNFK